MQSKSKERSKEGIKISFKREREESEGETRRVGEGKDGISKRNKRPRRARRGKVVRRALPTDRIKTPEPR